MITLTYSPGRALPLLTVPTISELIVFGDSYSTTDASGPLWHEHLSSILSVSESSSAVGGDNTQDTLAQVTTWLASNTPAANDYFFLAAIGNDMIEGTNVNTAFGYTETAADDLIAAGANNIIIFTSININVTPRAISPGIPGDHVTWMSTYTGLLNTYAQSHSEVTIYDFYTLSTDIDGAMTSAELWRDDIHMTTDGHLLIAADVLKKNIASTS